MKQVPDHWPPEGTISSTIVPMFPLPGVFLFPRQLMPLHIFEPRYRSMIEDSLDGPGRLVVATLREELGADQDAPAVLPVAGLGEIARHDQLPDGRFLIWLFGLARVRIREVTSESSYRLAECEVLEETRASRADEERLRPPLTEAILARSDTMLNLPEDLPITLLTDLLSQRMQAPQAVMAAIHSEHDTVRRAQRALETHRRFPKQPPPTAE